MREIAKPQTDHSDNFEPLTNHPEYEIARSGAVRNRRTHKLRRPQNNASHQTIQFKVNGTVAYAHLDELMASTFLNWEQGMLIKHLDGNPHNARVENLRVEPAVKRQPVTSDRHNGVVPTDDNTEIIWLPRPTEFAFQIGDELFLELPQVAGAFVGDQGTLLARDGQHKSINERDRAVFSVNGRSVNVKVRQTILRLFRPIADAQAFRVIVAHDAEKKNARDVNSLRYWPRFTKEERKRALIAWTEDRLLWFAYADAASDFFGIESRGVREYASGQRHFLYAFEDRLWKFQFLFHSKYPKQFYDDRDGFVQLQDWPSYEMHGDGIVRSLDDHLVVQPHYVGQSVLLELARDGQSVRVARAELLAATFKGNLLRETRKDQERLRAEKATAKTVLKAKRKQQPLWLPEPTDLKYFGDDSEPYAQASQCPGYYINQNCQVRNSRGKIMQLQQHDKGYQLITVKLSADRKMTTVVSRLALLAWKPIADSEDFEADHIDDDPSHNCLSNLQWLTRAANMKKAMIKRRQPLLLISERGEHLTLVGAKTAAKFLRCGKTTVRRRAEDGQAWELDGVAWYVCSLREDRPPRPIYDRRVGGFSCIPEFPLYEAHQDGTVRNKNTQQLRRSHINGGRVYLSIGGSTALLHRIIARLFVVNPDVDTKIEVNHIDGNPLNNCATNLEWVTRTENQLHAIYILGGLPRCAQIDQDGNVFKIWESQAEAARQLGISGSGINMVLRGKQDNVQGYRFVYAD